MQSAPTPSHRSRYREDVHPLEYLRAVSRHRRIPAQDLAVEFSRAVADWHFGGPELTLAARRMLEHRPDATPLWWVCANLVTAPDATRRAEEVIAVLESQSPVGTEDDRPIDDRFTIPLWAATTGDGLVIGAWVDRLSDAEVTDRPVVLAAGPGYRTRPEFFERISEGLTVAGERFVRIDLSRFTHRLDGPECPSAPELLRSSAI